MIRVNFYSVEASNGKKAAPVLKGAVALAKNKIQFAPATSSLMKGISLDPITVFDKDDEEVTYDPKKQPLEWIKNLYRQYKSYVLYATQAVDDGITEALVRRGKRQHLVRVDTRAELDKLFRKQRANVAKQARLRAKVRAGEHHTRSLQLKAEHFAARQKDIDMLKKRLLDKEPKAPLPPHDQALLNKILKGPDKPAAGGKTHVEVPAHVRTNPKTGEKIQVQAYDYERDSDKRIAKLFEEGEFEQMQYLGGGVEATYLGFIKKKSAGQNAQVAPVVFKAVNEDKVASEVAAVLVGRTLGLQNNVGVVIARRASFTDMKMGRKVDQIGAAIEFMNGRMHTAFALGNKALGSDPNLTAKLGAFDYIIGNFDRHENNWLTDGDSKIQAIDHERAFSTVDQHSSDFTRYIRKNHKDLTIKSVIGSSWDGKWPELEKVMKASKLKQNRIDAAKQRFDRLIDLKNSNKTFLDISQW